MRSSIARSSGIRLFGRLLSSAVLAGYAIAAAEPALASLGGTPAAAPGTPSIDELSSGTLPCTEVHLAAAAGYRNRIATAATVEEAQELAIQPSTVAKRALRVATLVAPSSSSLDHARERLDRYETLVRASQSPQGAAHEFENLLQTDTADAGLLQMADVNVAPVRVSGPGKCYYTTGEIVAVVFGFILFVVPGIILLILLC